MSGRDRTRKPRPGGRWALGVVAIVVVACSLVFAVSWQFANKIRSGVFALERDPEEFDIEIVDTGEGTITLTPADAGTDLRNPGIWGLQSRDAYGRVGQILSDKDGSVEREFKPLRGSFRNGDAVRLDNFAFPPDPKEALGRAYEEVSYETVLGVFAAWFFPGSRATWLVFVHGKGAERAEALRMLSVVGERGHPALVITYRNDEAAPLAPNARYDFGRDEWRDLEGAVRYAVDRGAADVILVGYSMGGAIVTNFLLRSPLAEVVRGVILDAPLLDLAATVDAGARDRGYPGLLSRIARWLAAQRFDIDWEAVDYLRRADELRVPILLFHGAVDDLVPVETSDRLAELRPDLVTYVRVAKAQHVRSWNVAPETYADAVGEFLERVAP